MPIMHRWPAMLAVALLCGCAATATSAPERAATPQPAVLGRYPLCEASGAVFAPCDAGGGRCLLVADNENARALFLFDVDGDRLSGQRAVPMMHGGAPEAVKDAEGLAPFADGLFLLGSHSRRAWDKSPPRCTRDPRRLVFALLRRDGNHFETAAVRTDAKRWLDLLRPEPCRSELFAARAAQGRAIADAVCSAIAAADPHAESSAEACWGSLNFEGVAALPDAGGERVWFGLRGPTAAGQAVLMRLASTQTLRFDAAAALDLGGDGVRDLAYANGWLWVLSGPSGDYRVPGTVWRIAAAEIVDGARGRPQRIAAVPAFAEALAIDASRGDAFVLVDGDHEKGDGGDNGCPEPARYLPLTLPLAPAP